MTSKGWIQLWRVRRWEDTGGGRGGREGGLYYDDMVQRVQLQDLFHAFDGTQRSGWKRVDLKRRCSGKMTSQQNRIPDQLDPTIT